MILKNIWNGMRRNRKPTALTSLPSRCPLYWSLYPLSVPLNSTRDAHRPRPMIYRQTSAQHRVCAQESASGSCCPSPFPCSPLSQLFLTADRPLHCPPKSTKVEKLPNTRRSQLFCSGSSWCEQLRTEWGRGMTVLMSTGERHQLRVTFFHCPPLAFSPR